MQTINLVATPENFNRKTLVKNLAEALEQKNKYLGAPSFAYQVGNLRVERSGAITLLDEVTNDEVARMIEVVSSMGITIENQGSLSESVEIEPQEEQGVTEVPTEVLEAATGQAEPLNDTEEQDHLTVELPESLFDENSFDNLMNLIEAKGRLIQKALGVDDLPVFRKDGNLVFEWFTCELDADHVKAYTDFVCALSRMAREQKHISNKEKEVPNEKYAFRCFLLRLGFIGKDYKVTRKVLMEKLEGSSAFKSGKKKEDENNEVA